MIESALFHFLRPDWLYGFIPLALLCLWLWQISHQHNAWRKIVSPALLPYLLVSGSRKNQRWSVFLILFTGTLGLLAMAGPTWERLPKPVFRDDAALIIALDLSRSMDAQDIKPSRIQRTHYKITDIIKARTEGQTALIVYAADAFTVTPLTDDGQTIISQLGALTPDLMPAQGNRVDLALALASDLLRQAGQTKGDILLITDEIPLATGLEEARKVNQQGYRLSVLGVGTAAGAPIPLRGGMLKDAHGNIVIPKLYPDQLQQIATMGGGRYATLSSNDSDIKQLAVNEVSRLDSAQSQSDDLSAEVWKEFGPWLLLPILPLAALAFRRGVLVLALLFILPLPQPANAFGWKDLWQTPDQRAQQLMQQEQPQAAAKQFKDPAWKGSALYKTGDFKNALENFQSSQGAEARYNEGNTLAKLGKLKEAIKAYDKALQSSPEHEDARYNRKLVEDALKQQQQQNQNNSDQDNKQDQAGGSSEKKSGDNSDPADNQDQSGQPQSNDKPSTQDQSGHEQSNQDQADNQKQNQPQQNDKKDASASGGEQEKDTPAQQQNQQVSENGNASNAPDNTSLTAEAEALNDEERQAREQWLNRIKDDPAGLLKRKFKYQYQQRARQNNGEKTW